jgi:hypothetical protein
LRGGSFRRAFRAEALRRGELPRTAASPAPAAVGPRRNVPDAAPREPDQAITLVPSATFAVQRSQPPGRNAAHCLGRSLQPQRCFASRFAGRAYGAPFTLEPLPAQWA